MLWQNVRKPAVISPHSRSQYLLQLTQRNGGGDHSIQTETQAGNKAKTAFATQVVPLSGMDGNVIAELGECGPFQLTSYEGKPMQESKN